MQKAGWISIAVAALLSTASFAQDRKDGESSTPPAATQPAPADAGESASHDVQTGKPSTGENPEAGHKGQNKDTETQAEKDKRKANEAR